MTNAVNALIFFVRIGYVVAAELALIECRLGGAVHGEVVPDPTGLV